MIYIFGDFVLDTQSYTLHYSGQPLHVRPKAFQVLCYLIEQRDRVVDKQELSEQIWPDQFISNSTLDSTIRAVRHLVRDRAREPQIIQTFYGSGYRFIADVTSQEEARIDAATESHVDLEPATMSEPSVHLPATRAWTCAVCQHLNREEIPGVGRFCAACGSSRQAHCPQCGASVLSSARFCSTCGFALPSTEVVSAPSTSPPLSSADASYFERRQLTVLFCDLVDSTTLTHRLDLEDSLEIIRAYQNTCVEIIRHMDGYVAQYLGDGIMAYFGYPLAHEDDARRAIHASLDILGAIRQLSLRFEQKIGTPLAAQLGIHTGRVIMGERSTGERLESLAVGDTPHIAARLQSVAEPDTVVMSEATARLVQGYFTYKDLGVQPLQGAASPVRLFQVISPATIRHRLDIAGTDGLPPMVGRAPEWALLQDRWRQVEAGTGGVVILSGEAGIGKSRLARMLVDHLSDGGYETWVCQCSPYHQYSAFYPIIELFQRLLGWLPHEAPPLKREKLETALQQLSLPLEETRFLLAALLSLPLEGVRDPCATLTSKQRYDKTLEAIMAVVLACARQSPVLLLVEDLHWVDPSTLQLLQLLVDQTPMTRLGVVLVSRPAFQMPWAGRSYVTEITLTRLPLSDIEQMMTGIAGGTPLPVEVLRQVMDKTDGVPLFVEELTKAILEADVALRH